MANRWRKVKTVTDLISWAPKSLWTVTTATKLKDAAPWKKSCDKPRQHTKKQKHHFAGKGPYSQSYGFPVVMYRCESWTVKKAEHRRIDALNHGVGEDS